MSGISDGLLYFLGCVLPIVAGVALAVIARVRPQWFEWAAGEPMPKKMKRRARR